MNERHRRAIIVAIVLLVAAIACLFGMQIMLDSADQNAGALEEQLVTAQTEIASLKAEQAAAAESAALAEQVATEKTQLETQLTTAQAKIASLKAEQAVLAESAALAEQLAAEKAQLETQLTAAQAQIDALKVQPTATPVPEMPEAEAGVPDAAQTIAELTADVAALTAERDSLMADNAELQTQNAALQAQLALGQAKDQEEVPTMLTLRDGAVELGLVNPAQPGQTLRVRMYAGTEVLGEALATQPGEEITSLMLNGASAGEAQLEYAVLNPQGDVVYRVRIPVQLAEE